MSEAKPFDLASAARFLESAALPSGLTFDPDKLASAAAKLVVNVERTADGGLAYTPAGYSTGFRIVAGKTVEIPVGEAIAEMIRSNTTPVPVSKPASDENITTTPAAPSSAPRWAQHSTSVIADVARSIAAQEDAAVARESEGWPNPWLPGQLNRTRQQLIINKNPRLAAKYKREAGL